MVRARQGTLDNILTPIKMTSFEGGLNTYTGPLGLGPNQFPGGINFLNLPSWCKFRGGYTVYSTIPAPADQSFSFKDINGAYHYMVWAAGSLYDTAGGGASLVESNIYNAVDGVQIGCTTNDGILYWSVGYPNQVRMRFWDPVAGTKGQLPGNYGPAGAVDPPSTGFMFMFAGSIVCLAPFWGASNGTGTNIFQPSTLAFSETNLVNTWIGDNSQQIGSNNGGQLTYACQFGLGNTGISPTRTIMVFRNDADVFAMNASAGLTNMIENALNCTVGLKDPFSVQYNPSVGEFGVLIWLGVDGQFWSTQGVNCLPISAQQILPTLQTAFKTALSINPNARFCSGFNQDWQYYWCDVGGVQFVWSWINESWGPPFQGWPIGPSFNAFDALGESAYFTASRSPIAVNPFILGQSSLGSLDVLASNGGSQNAYVVAQIARMGFGDNGIMPPVFINTPIFHGGTTGIYKRWHEIALCTLDTGVLYNVTGKSIARSDGTIQTTRTIPMQAPNNNAQGFKLGTSVLGGPDVLQDPTIASLNPGNPVVMQNRLVVPIPVTKWWPAGNFNLLEGNAAQFNVAYGGGTNAFDLLAIEARYLAYGNRRGAGTYFDSEMLAGQPFDPFYGFLNTSGKSG